MADHNQKTDKTKNGEIRIDVNDQEVARGYEKGAMEDNPNFKRILFWSVLGFVIFIGFVYMLSGMYWYNSYRVEKNISSESSYFQLQDLRENAEERLTTYGVINAEEGIYRIPIDSAINKYVKENN